MDRISGYDAKPGGRAEIQTNSASADQENSNRQLSGLRGHDVQPSQNSAESPLSAQPLAGEPPEPPGSAQLGNAASEAPAAPCSGGRGARRGGQGDVRGRQGRACGLVEAADRDRRLQGARDHTRPGTPWPPPSRRRDWMVCGAPGAASLTRGRPCFTSWALGRGLLPIGPATMLDLI